MDLLYNIEQTQHKEEEEGQHQRIIQHFQNKNHFTCSELKITLIVSHLSMISTKWMHYVTGRDINLQLVSGYQCKCLSGVLEFARGHEVAQSR